MSEMIEWCSEVIFPVCVLFVIIICLVFGTAWLF
jgi:signal peptidase I